MNNCLNLKRRWVKSQRDSLSNKYKRYLADFGGLDLPNRINVLYALKTLLKNKESRCYKDVDMNIMTNA
jgi:hypothetical protein